MNDITTLHRLDPIADALDCSDDRMALYADPAFAEMLEARLAGLLPAGGGVLSLDVFDTLVLRDNSAEITRFVAFGAAMAEAARRAAPEGGARAVTAEDAFLARQWGTFASYRATDRVKGAGEGSLTEIHRTASRLLVGDDRLAEAFIEAELDAEALRMRANPFWTRFIPAHRARGGRVLLLSDMYMHAPQIAALLARLGIGEDAYDLLLSSADTKVSKASGGLFALAEDRLSAGPGAFVHLGDSLKGDYQMPRRQGWASVLLPVSAGDLAARQADHLATAAELHRRIGHVPQIAFPK